MSMLPAAIIGGSSLLGSVLGGKSQQSAANTAAQAAQDQLNTELQYLQNAGTEARGAIGSMLPYAQGASQAASATRANVPYLTPGQGAVFGGQQVQATPTGGSVNYSSLLSGQTPQTLGPMPNPMPAALPASTASTPPPVPAAPALAPRGIQPTNGMVTIGGQQYPASDLYNLTDGLQALKQNGQYNIIGGGGGAPTAAMLVGATPVSSSGASAASQPAANSTAIMRALQGSPRLALPGGG